jgi:hypothetical protein
VESSGIISFSLFKDKNTALVVSRQGENAIGILNISEIFTVKLGKSIDGWIFLSSSNNECS